MGNVKVELCRFVRNIIDLLAVIFGDLVPKNSDTNKASINKTCLEGWLFCHNFLCH